MTSGRIRNLMVCFVKFLTVFILRSSCGEVLCTTQRLLSANKGNKKLFMNLIFSLK